MFKYITLLILISIANSEKLEFNQTGIYGIIPQDYNYVEFIEIELWASDFDQLISTPHLKRNNDYVECRCPSGAGPYLKFALETKQKRYKIEINIYNNNQYAIGKIDDWITVHDGESEELLLEMHSTPENEPFSKGTIHYPKKIGNNIIEENYGEEPIVCDSFKYYNPKDIYYRGDKNIYCRCNCKNFKSKSNTRTKLYIKF